MKSLGDETPEYAVLQETHPMPIGGRKGLLTTLDVLMSAGGVQKFTVEMGKPIKLLRAVPKSEAAASEFPAALLEDPDDFYLAARNAVIEPLAFGEPKNAFEYLWFAFNNMMARNTAPKVALVPQKKQLAEWLKVTDVGGWLFGVKIIEDKNIPDEAMLLVGSDLDDRETVTLSFRMEMVVPSLHVGRIPVGS